MSPPGKPSPSSKICFPRVSGDEPRVSLPLALEALFSPRERG